MTDAAPAPRDDTAAARRLDAARSVLVVVDVQERLLPAVLRPEPTLANLMLLAGAAARLGVPAVATEHVPEAIGGVVADLGAALSGAAVVRKETFSAADTPAFVEALPAERDHAVVCGLETHVCVLQTALELVNLGKRVYLAADAVSSRTDIDRDTALRRLEQAGAAVVTAEMVVFEWLRRGTGGDFKALLPVIRDRLKG